MASRICRVFSFSVDMILWMVTFLLRLILLQQMKGEVRTKVRETQGASKDSPTILHVEYEQVRRERVVNAE